MKRIIIFVSFIIYSICCSAQVTFEPAYFINNDGEKINCFIKNKGWKNNPRKFEYKLKKNGASKTGTIETIKEFSVAHLKYKRFIVNIDQSSKALKKLSANRKPVFKEEILFLRSLIEGKANLFLYESNKFMYFLYNVNNTNVKQLVYKKYLMPDNKIGLNGFYKQQIWEDLRYEEVSIEEVQKLDYNKEALIAYFKIYNNANDSDIVDFDEKDEKKLFNLRLKLGLGQAGFSIRNAPDHFFKYPAFNDKVYIKMGFEVESILPFYKNKWAFIVEPTFQRFKSENKTNAEPNAIIEYNSLEVPFGLRHYFFLNDNSKIFLDALYTVDVPFGSKIDIEKHEGLDINPEPNIQLDIGYNHKNKLTVAFRYASNRDLLGAYKNVFSTYKSIWVLFGYTLFHGYHKIFIITAS